MAKKDSGSDKDEPNHAGSVAPEDKDLTLWLNKLWARNEPPARIEVWQAFGRNELTRGEMVHHTDFKPNEKLDIEQATRLANEIMAACQHDCDSKHRPKPASYQLAVIDRNRTSSPLVRRIGPLQPKRNYALARSEAIEDGETDDDDISIKSIELKRLQIGNEEVRWDKQRNDRVLGDVLMLLRDDVIENRTYTKQLMGQMMDFFGKLQEAEDRRLEREIRLEREKFKVGLMKEGVRTARNLLPALFAKEEPNAIESNGYATNGHTNGNGAVKDYGASQERTLVGNFLHDIEEEGEALHLALFGNFEEQNGRMVQVKPGVFLFDQFRTLVGVRQGHLPVIALDNLLPKSGHPLSITEKQVELAADAGVTEGMVTALLEIIGLRARAKEAKEAAATAANANGTTKTPEATPPA